MMKRKLKVNGGRRRADAGETTSASSPEDVKWEMRPGGMLVQKRSDNSDVVSSAPIIHIRIAFGALHYDLSVNSQATFGEVKKAITAETGLQAAEQRLIYRGKERENGEYLDMCGVKDRSKLVLIEDPECQERRFIQMRRNAKIQTAHRLIDDLSTQLDKLSDQVSAIEKKIGNGKKVAELQITTLIEMLMAQAVKLDNIHAQGDAFACAQKNLQGERVQKCVERLDEMKVANAKVKPVLVTNNHWKILDQPPLATTTWELFD